MSNHTEIAKTIAEAFEALALQPTLQTMMGEVEHDRNNLKLEVELYREEVEKLRGTIEKLYVERDGLNGQIAYLNTELGAANRTIEELRNNNAYLTDKVTQHSDTIRNRELAIEIHEADKAALRRELEDSRGLGHKLSSMIKGFMSEVTQTLPSEVGTATFPEVTQQEADKLWDSYIESKSEAISEPVQLLPEPAQPVVETNPVDNTVEAEPAKTAIYSGYWA